MLGIPGVDRQIPGRGGHLWRGDVTRMDGRRAWVEVPALFGDNPAGPFDVLDTGVPVTAGARVLVAAADGDQDDLIVVGVIK